MSLVINLFGASGVGKTAIAALLLYNLKVRGYNVALVTDYVAKLNLKKNGIGDDVEERLRFNEEQDARLSQMEPDVDIIINDNPLLMNLVYSSDKGSRVASAVTAAFNKYNNLNAVLYGYRTYDSVDKMTAAEKIQRDIYLTLGNLGIEYELIPPFEDGAKVIIEKIMALKEEEEKKKAEEQKDGNS